MPQRGQTWVGPVVCATSCGLPHARSESKRSDLSANQSLSSSPCSQRTALGCMSNADDFVSGEVCSPYAGHLAAFRSRGIYAVLGKKLLRPPPSPLWDIKSGRTWSLITDLDHFDSLFCVLDCLGVEIYVVSLIYHITAYHHSTSTDGHSPFSRQRSAWSDSISSVSSS